MTPKRERFYALYKGEEMLAEGTVAQIARDTGKTIKSLLFMTCPCYSRLLASRKRKEVGALEMQEVPED